MKEEFGPIEELCALTDALLCKVNAAQVLRGQAFFDSIPVHEAAVLLFKTQQRYQNCSLLECENAVDSIVHRMCDRDILRMRSSRPGQVHVFELLSDLADALLLQQNGEVLCRYTHILYWRRLVQSIGEELPVTTVHVIRDMERGYPSREHFAWDYVVRQNNEPLNQLLRRGISDHHMHLWASVPYFQVSWLNLMNDIAYSPYLQSCLRIDQEEWSLDQEWSAGQEWDLARKRRVLKRRGEGSLVSKCQQAALIRVYLCARLKGLSLRLARPRVPCQRTQGDQETENFLFVRELLQNPQLLQMGIGHIQAAISSLRAPDGGYCVDYALGLTSGPQDDRDAYQVFSGERWFLYSMLRDIYLTQPALSRNEHNLFYAYLLLQIQIRSQMVQVDSKVGLDHFRKIQRRKSYFLGDSRSKELIMRLAVREPLQRMSHLRELEVRIVPGDTVAELRQDIAELERATAGDIGWDRLGLEGGTEAENLRKRYYYILHFTREMERAERFDSGRYSFEYRHYRFRKRLAQKGDAIRKFRESWPSLARRIRGIDVCSMEIGCRPEQFACVFRMLGAHSCKTDELDRSRPLPRLRKTYHVGEDFLDLADGLRAIDEAINFLNLDCGDRLGHALALCIDPWEWYQGKNRQISLPIQDYLDNIAWLHYVIRRHPFSGMEQTILLLESQFEYYFWRVYLNNMDEEETLRFVQRGESQYKGKESARNYKAHHCLFTMEDYIRAWMLRGDHPELYRSGYFWVDGFPTDDWPRFQVNGKFHTDPSIRYIPECSFLYFSYHYNIPIRQAGAEYITVTVRDDYIRGVEAAQKALQFDIANRGLSVESNPTSNVKISTVPSYAEHPIIRLYNNGLVHDPERLRNCPQISVSINTDDSGVFFTSLESEYAVIARSLETLQDEDGQSRYYKWEIYDWLDRIRQMGNDQSFQSDE